MHREVNRLQHRHLVDGPSWRSHTTVLGNPGVQKRRAEVRRASPPRPSLLVGDLAACHDAFSKLQQRVAQLLEASGPAASQADWEPLVVRCRALRESLMSLGRLDAFAMRVFEVSADVCLRARDFSEFLKSARHLLHDIYPTLASQQAMEANAALEAVSSRLANTRIAACERWAEFAGNFLLYFICVPAKTQGLDVVSVLRGLPHSLQRCSHVQFATSVKCALQAGDFTSFFKLHRRASWSQRTLLDLKLVQMRAWTVSVLASAYRTLSCRSAWRMLALNSGCPQAELLALLKANAESGNAAAANAYSALQMEDPNVQALLVFKS
ncbi:hypothetical protein WJX72_011122 [[Myrmecia] bisecta]|uniref:SAC3/GANP/THP3 conserved domain-containing protein n=1 Tax=[Myrmecia] bisecta TaxID=41462 RepID=A0AAW1R9Q9_9CHLO